VGEMNYICKKLENDYLPMIKVATSAKEKVSVLMQEEGFETISCLKTIMLRLWWIRKVYFTSWVRP